MNRTEHSRTYLFSGLMECGVCGKSITIVSGRAPNVRYGCPSHRYRGVCTNAVTISRRRLEHQLISALSANLADPRLEEERVRAFTEQLKATLQRKASLAHQAQANQSELKDERSQLQKQVANLVAAIAEYGLSPNLKAQLAASEARLAELDRLLESKPRPEVPQFSDQEVRDFLRKKSLDLTELLLGDPALAKHELQKRITRLVLTPRETPEGTVLDVSGDVALFVPPDVMLTNSMEGIAEHYTDAMSFVFNTALDPRLPLAA